MNIGVYKSFKIRVFIFSGYMTRNGIAGSYSKFLRNLHILLHSGCMNLHSYQQCRWRSFSSHLLQHLLFVDFLMLAILTGDTSLICIVFVFLWFVFLQLSTLSTFSYASWPSVCLLWRNVCLGLLSTFWLDNFFLILSYLSYLYILEINPLLVASFANIFSHSIDCLFVLFMISFTVKKTYKFN